MKKYVLIPLAFVLLAVLAFAGPVTNPPPSVTLAWTPTPAPWAITNYSLWWGGASGVYTNHLDTGTSTNCTVTEIFRGSTYYFAATDTCTNGLTSTYSNEVQFTVPVPPPAPTGLTIQAAQ